MRVHRFDPFSFVVGLATAVFGGMLLWGDLDVTDLRPSRLWPLPVFALGLLLTLYGVRRLLESGANGSDDDEHGSDVATIDGNAGHDER
jgi:hypothetical protein